MLASVRYRLPGETLVHEIGTKHPPKRCTSLAEIPPQKGYLFAPFQENDAHPLWFFPADEQRTWTQPTEVPSFSLAYEVEEDHRTEYIRAFEACQAAFQQSELQKVVLSRTLSVHFDQNLTKDDYYRLFEQACIAYPNSFVSLISLPALWGTWLMATPEILISAQDSMWHTMALAGTMEKTADSSLSLEVWSEKNRKEQQWVVDYISRQLEKLDCDYQKSPTYVRPAAHLLHLCTDFSVIPPKEKSIACVIEALHPTPAVCGWETSTAKALISKVESHNRSYYSGYSGPIAPNSAHLFVTLRCMNLINDTATLYAGGGLLPESNENSEWQETERKLNTMLRLFSAHK